jgi:hypothetical protein
MFRSVDDSCRRGEEARGLTMIKLFSVKQKQKEDAQNNNGRPIKKQSAGELRVQKGPNSRFRSFSRAPLLTLGMARCNSPFYL